MRKYKIVMMLAAAAVLSMVMMTGCQKTKGVSDQGDSKKQQRQQRAKKRLQSPIRPSPLR